MDFKVIRRGQVRCLRGACHKMSLKRPICEVAENVIGFFPIDRMKIHFFYPEAIGNSFTIFHKKPHARTFFGVTNTAGILHFHLKQIEFP